MTARENDRFSQKIYRISTVEKPQFPLVVTYYSYLLKAMPWQCLFSSRVVCYINFGSFMLVMSNSLNTETSVETRIVNTDREFSYRCYSSLSSLESREQRPRVKKKNNKITKLKKKLRNETRNRMFLLNYHQSNSSRHHATILFLVRISLVSPAIFRPS